MVYLHIITEARTLRVKPILSLDYRTAKKELYESKKWKEICEHTLF